MSVIEKLDSVLEILNHSDAFFDEMFDAAKELLRDHGPALRQAMIDAERYRWLRDCDIEGEDAVMLRMSDFGRDELLSGDELDAAIDAARATGEGEGHD